MGETGWGGRVVSGCGVWGSGDEGIKGRGEAGTRIRGEESTRIRGEGGTRGRGDESTRGRGHGVDRARGGHLGLAVVVCRAGGVEGQRLEEVHDEWVDGQAVEHGSAALQAPAQAGQDVGSAGEGLRGWGGGWGWGY